MKIINSYILDALYNVIYSTFLTDEYYFCLLQKPILEIYKIDKNNNVNIISKYVIDNASNFIKIFGFSNYSYIWIYLIDKEANIYELKIDLKTKKLLYQEKIDYFKDEILVSMQERNGIIQIYTIEPNSNILYMRQIITDLNSPVYHFTEKHSYAVLPDLNDYKVDKTALILNSNLDLYL